jgi:hypothetical protein
MSPAGASLDFDDFSAITAYEAVSLGAGGLELTPIQRNVSVTTTAAGTLTLPFPSQAQEKTFSVYFATDAGDLTIALPGAGSIDLVLQNAGEYALFYSNGYNWYTVHQGNRTLDVPALKQHVTTIATAAVLTLNATEVSILPAPGAGYVNVVEGVMLFLDYNSIAYSGVAAGEDLIISYTDASGQIIATVETAAFMIATADDIAYAVPFDSTADVQSGLVVPNAAVVISLLSAEIAAGNSPLLTKVFYRTLPITFS